MTVSKGEKGEIDRGEATGTELAGGAHRQVSNGGAAEKGSRFVFCVFAFEREKIEGAC